MKRACSINTYTDEYFTCEFPARQKACQAGIRPLKTNYIRMKMKKYVVVVFAAVLLLGVQNSFAENKTENFKVYGNCGQCENRIETAAKTMNGVVSAQWDKSNKSLTVSYDDKKTTMQKIQTSIAMTGHDTPMFSASESGYNQLPGCCKYKRDANRKKNTHGTGESVYNKSEKSGSCCDNK